MLRRDLSARAAQLAHTHGYLHELSTGASPAILFGRDGEGRHGNFHPAAYDRICAHADWLQRLAKVHTASRRSRARHDWQWMELDSASSSDALLMNIFCHPDVFDGAQLATPVAALLNVDRTVQPCFGARPGVPLRSQRRGRAGAHDLAGRPGLTDRTEIDLKLGSLFVEAKLTEADFQTAAPALVERYRDLEDVFDVDRLPRRVIARTPRDPLFDPDDPTLNLPRPSVKLHLEGYQLIRNVLAAFAAEASFCVLCDARRHDLIDLWYSVLSAVQAPGFAWRLKLLTWQELAAALSPDLQTFLSVKYGIEPPE
jgi:hypothetical protein